MYFYCFYFYIDVDKNSDKFKLMNGEDEILFDFLILGEVSKCMNWF